jgi:hypothetical protein
MRVCWRLPCRALTTHAMHNRNLLPQQAEASEQDKASIRAALPAGLQDSDSKVRTAVAVAVAAIANWDWPNAWPGLLEHVVGAIKAHSNPNLGAAWAGACAARGWGAWELCCACRHRHTVCRPHPLITHARTHARTLRSRWLPALPVHHGGRPGQRAGAAAAAGAVPGAARARRQRTHAAAARSHVLQHLGRACCSAGQPVRRLPAAGARCGRLGVGVCGVGHGVLQRGPPPAPTCWVLAASVCAAAPVPTLAVCRPPCTPRVRAGQGRAGAAHAAVGAGGVRRAHGRAGGARRQLGHQGGCAAPRAPACGLFQQAAVSGHAAAHDGHVAAAAGAAGARPMLARACGARRCRQTVTATTVVLASCRRQCCGVLLRSLRRARPRSRCTRPCWCRARSCRARARASPRAMTSRCRWTRCSQT